MPTTHVGTDRIRKQVLLRAPRARVWQAIGDAREFGSWFGVELEGPFVAGQVVRGRIVPTTVDLEVARMQEPHAGTPFEIHVEQVEPQRRLAFRWHPGVPEPGEDPASEPMTLVELLLEDAPGGTLLTLTESGFDRISLARRAKALEGNEQGWTAQMTLIEKYLARDRAPDAEHGS